MKTQDHMGLETLVVQACLEHGLGMELAGKIAETACRQDYLVSDFRGNWKESEEDREARLATLRAYYEGAS